MDVENNGNFNAHYGDSSNHMSFLNGKMCSKNPPSFKSNFQSNTLRSVFIHILTLNRNIESEFYFRLCDLGFSNKSLEMLI